MRIAATICFIVFMAVFCGCSNEKIPVIAPPTNSASMATTDIAADKPVIIAFGDSLTAGFGISDPKKSYPSLMQESLSREGFDYQVVNLGLGGDTSEGGLKRLWLALKYKNVKVFVLELGANDIIKKKPAAEIKPNLTEIIKRIRATGAEVVLCGYAPPASFGNDYVTEIRDMYEQLAKEFELPLIPDFMKDVSGNSERMLDDGIHPNEKGAEVIEQNVFSFVKPLLAKNDGGKKK